MAIAAEESTRNAIRIDGECTLRDMEDRQQRAFLEGEADAWYERNVESLVKAERPDIPDPVWDAVNAAGLNPPRVLEVGCSNGWRLGRWAGLAPETRLAGIDPSERAIDAGRQRFPDVDLRVAAASEIPFDDDSFDLVIFGFSLYLCDRRALFRIAGEADRVLADAGHVAVYDYCPAQPHRRVYRHLEPLSSFKMDHAEMFTWHPGYQRVSVITWPYPGCAADDLDNRMAITLLRCDRAAGFPLREPTRGASASTAPEKPRKPSQNPGENQGT